MIKNFVKKLKPEHWAIIFIVLLSLFLRLFRISSYMTFLGDEGRDALVWLRMLHGKLTLIGPMTSIGNMYLGPLYYYLMLPFYVLLGTAGPSVGVALFAGATTFLLWYCGREWFSEKVGLLAALFYAISPVAIVLSRSSWNPNVMPFFALLTIWGVWQFWQNDKYYWLAIDGILLSFAVQSHYLGVLLIPVVGLFFVIKLISLIKSKSKNVKMFLFSFILCSLFIILLTVLPLIWFDLRHNFINYKAFYKFFSERQTTVNFKAYKALPQIWPLWQMIITQLLTRKDLVLGTWLSLIFGLGVVISTIFTLLLYRNKVFERRVMILLLVWLVIGLIGMGLYKQHIYDHYFGFLFPAIFLLFAYFIQILWKINLFGKVAAILMFVSVTFSLLTENPLKYPPNYQMKHTAEVSKKILEESKGEKFNLGLIAKQNYDVGYRYFLEKWGSKTTEIDAQKADQTITHQLFVICEISDCQPTTSPQAEIANFGWSKIDQKWDFPWGVKLYRLVHYNNKI